MEHLRRTGERLKDLMQRRILLQSSPVVLALLVVGLADQWAAGDAHWSAFVRRICQTGALLVPVLCAHVAACRWRPWPAISVWLMGFLAYPLIFGVFAPNLALTTGEWVLVAGCSLIFLVLHPDARNRDGKLAAGEPPILRMPITLDGTIAILLGLWVLVCTSILASTPDAVRNQPLGTWFDGQRILSEPGETLWYMAQIAVMAGVLFGWYWICRYVLVQRVLRQLGIVPFAIALAGCVVLVTPIAASIGIAMPMNIPEWTLTPSESHNPFDPINYRFSVWLTAILIPVLLIVERLRAEQTQASARHETVRAELYMLQQQINPHFLFNTLNTLYALCLRNRAESAGAVVKLSDLLRYVVYRGQAERVGLDEEIAYLTNYLDLQQLRFGHRCTLQTSWPLSPAGLGLPPLLLIMLVENAFKHGVEPHDGPCTVQISAAVRGRTLSFECINSFSDAPLAGVPGTGLTNLRRRLELLFGQEFDLSSRPDHGGWRARLRLELEPC